MFRGEGSTDPFMKRGRSPAVYKLIIDDIVVLFPKYDGKYDVHTHIHTYTQSYIQSYTYTQSYAHSHIHIHTIIHTHNHIYKPANTHGHMFTYILVLPIIYTLSLIHYIHIYTC